MVAPAALNPAFITVGQGVKNASGKRVNLDETIPAPNAVRRILKQPGGTESWWSPHCWKNNHRVADAWEGATAAAVDVDYHNAANKHVAVPAEDAMALAGLVQDGQISTNLFHATPRGARLVILFAQPERDPDRMKRVLRFFAQRTEDQLRQGGLGWEEGRGGFLVDAGATLDLARLFFLPGCRVDGEQRQAPVMLVSSKPEDTTEVDLPPPPPAPVNSDVQTADTHDPNRELALRTALCYLPSDDYADWFEMGLALYRSELPEAVARELWLEWSRRSSKFEEASAGKKWGNICKAAPRDGGITVASIFHEAMSRGWRRQTNSHKPTVEEGKPRPQPTSPLSVVERWLADGPDVHVKTGIPQLDEQTGGGPVYGSRWYLVGAPDAGKTLLLTQIADVLSSSGVHVGILAVDEEPGDIVTRLLQRRSWLRRYVEDRSDPESMRADAGGMRINLYDDRWTIDSAAEDLATRAEGQPSMLGIDSIQVVRCAEEESGRGMSVYDRVTARTRAIQTLATRHRMLIIATSEMGRAFYRNRQSAEQLDEMASGKESGSIEYKARVQINLRSAKGETDLIELRLAKNKQGPRTPDGEHGIHLRLNRDRQILTPEVDYVPPPDTQDADRDHRTRERCLTDAGVIASILAKHPGLNARGLRTNARAQGSIGKDRQDAAEVLLGNALVTREGKRTAIHHYLDGEALPVEILEKIPLPDRPTVRAAKPPDPEPGEPGESEKRGRA